jgi:hypothetical protein
MKSFSDKLLMLLLSIALGLSPLQNIMASVSDCMSSSHSMHQQMKMSGKVMQHDMSQTETKDDCCKQNACDMTHCANAFIAIFVSNPINEVVYTVASLSSIPTNSLIPLHTSSLYRPPKI